jgi:hypothetical protein
MFLPKPDEIAILSFLGSLVAVGAHDQRAKVCFLGAAAAAIIAFATRPPNRPMDGR